MDDRTPHRGAPRERTRIGAVAAMPRWTGACDVPQEVVELLVAAADAAMLAGRLQLAERHRLSVLEVQRLR